VTGPSEETSNPSVLCPPFASPSASSTHSTSIVIFAHAPAAPRTVIDGDAVNDDARTADGNRAHRTVLHDHVLERPAVVDPQQRRRLRLPAGPALAVPVLVTLPEQLVAVPVDCAGACEQSGCWDEGGRAQVTDVPFTTMSGPAHSCARAVVNDRALSEVTTTHLVPERDVPEEVDRRPARRVDLERLYTRRQPFLCTRSPHDVRPAVTWRYRLSTRGEQRDTRHVR
jgi:DNA-binding transcriptional LysR family regulator